MGVVQRPASHRGKLSGVLVCGEFFEGMSKITFLEPTWREWVVSNLQRKCSHESMVGSMVEKNFDAEFANSVVLEVAKELESGGDVVGLEFTRRIEEIGRGVAVGRPDAAGGSVGRPATTGMDTIGPAKTGMGVEGHSARHAERDGYVAEASRFAERNVIHVGDRAVTVLARLKQPEVLVLGNVLSDDECLELMRRSEVKLARSTTIDPKTGKEIVVESRSSSGTFFHLNEDDFIARIDQQLAELLRWPVDHGEGLQILRYAVNGEYRPHFDYFPPSDTGSGPHVAQGGQRIGTLVMYLNDVDEGGETIFPEIGLSVVPRRGHAVYFGYCNSRGDIDPQTLHGGAPVRAGVKWIATKWLRQHRRG